MEPQNPYIAPRETALPRRENRDYGFAVTRLYLGLHLATVIATTAIQLPVLSDRCPLVLLNTIHVAAAIGLPILLFGSPLMMICLVTAGWRYQRRYFVAAAAEFILWLAHWFVALPAVQ